jgi:azurin
LKGLENEFKLFLNWKSSNNTEPLAKQKINEELKEDIKEFSKILDRHESIINKSQAKISKEEELIDGKITVRISAIPGQMAYDKETFTVVAGQTVEIIFSNPDHMQHNLLIIKPGKLEEVGEMADKMSGEPDGFKKEFIPETDNVLFATPLLDQDENYSLIFTAPETVGDFPFACTFPGHWRIMNGIMKVIAKEQIL